MSQQKIFITGASGYVGGSVLHSLTQSFNADRVEITALVRNEEKATKIVAAYPHVKIAIGDFKSTSVIEKAAEESNIVIHTVSDNVAAVNAILAGLNRRASPSFLIHTSGSGIIADTAPASYGQPPAKAWSDVADMLEISTFPDEGHLHRHVDKLILPLSAATNNKIRTAIVCPPVIYGLGTGTGNNQSIMIPLYAELISANPAAGAFLVGAGKNVQSVSHIREVVDVFILLVSEALQPNGGKADWGSEGFYFTATSTMPMANLAEKFVAIAKKRNWLPDTTPDTPQYRRAEDASEPFGMGALFWGSNAVTKADRAKKVFGWEGQSLSWQESLEGDMEAAFAVARSESLKWLAE